MKLKNLVTTALLAIASFAIVTPAEAATTTYNNGDLFLGFRATGGTGASTDYLLDIGQPTQFDHTFTLMLGNIAADLSATYGSSWYSRTDLLFAVAGGEIVENLLYATKPTATPWNRAFDQSGGSQAFASIGTGYDAKTSTTNSPVAILQLTSADNSYASWQIGGEHSPTTSFQFFPSSTEKPVAQSLYFDKLIEGANTPGQLLGSFSIANTGDVTFTAVPEPSTVATLAVGTMFLLLTAARRRNATKAW